MAEESATDEAKEPEKAPESKPEETKVPEGAENPDAVKRALDAERKAAKEAQKRAEAAEARVQEFEDANKSELEKAQTQVANEKQRRVVAETKLLRFEVASEKAVPAKLVPLLTASTKEDLEAQADLILENAKPADPDFDGGAREPAPDPKTPEQTHNDIALQLLGGR